MEASGGWPAVCRVAADPPELQALVVEHCHFFPHFITSYFLYDYLLDNDFFGQPREQWEARIAEIREGGFKVCLNQGINIRMIDQGSTSFSRYSP